MKKKMAIILAVMATLIWIENFLVMYPFYHSMVIGLLIGISAVHIGSFIHRIRDERQLRKSINKMMFII